MGEATLVRRYPRRRRLGQSALYRLNPPIQSDIEPGAFEYVLVSSNGGWTRVFPANRCGDVQWWMDVVDLGGAGAQASDEEVLRALGYMVIDEEEEG